MGMGLSLGLGLGSCGHGGGGSALTAPFYDAFDAPTGSINGRVPTTGQGTWAISPYAGSNTAALSVLVGTPGYLSGTQGTAPQQSFAYPTSITVSNRKWVTRGHNLITSIVGGATVILCPDHITIGGGTFTIGGVVSSAASGVAGALTFRSIVNGAAGTSVTIGTNFVLVDKDVGQMRYDVSGSDVVGDYYLNGRKVTASPINLSVTFSTLPITHAHGFRGNLPNTAAIEDFQVGNPDTDAMISLTAPNRIQQTESDGGVYIPLNCDYSVSTPTSIDYQLLDPSSGSALVAYTPAPTYTAGSLSSTGRTAKLSAASAAGGWVTWVRRRMSPATSVYSYSHGPVQKAGQVRFWYGQSLASNLLFATTGGITQAAPADCWVLDATLGQGGTVTYASPALYRQLKVTDNSPNAVYAAKAQGASPKPWAIVRAARGGSLASARAVGTDNYNAALAGLAFAGGRIGKAVNVGGHFEIAGAAAGEVANYGTVTHATFQGFRAESGDNFIVQEVPVSAVHGGVDADANSVRKQQWMLSQTYPTLYYPGPNLCDIQHVSADPYHFLEYSEEARRIGIVENRQDTGSSLIAIGPLVVSASITALNTVSTVLNLNGTEGLELVNTAYASDFRGGLRYYSDAAMTTELLPTAATLGSIASGQQAVIAVFASLPATVYVTAIRGANPFNPSNDSAINADMANKASMLRGTVTGEPSVPVQAFFQVSGGDYVTAV